MSLGGQIKMQCVAGQFWSIICLMGFPAASLANDQQNAGRRGPRCYLMGKKYILIFTQSICTKMEAKQMTSYFLKDIVGDMILANGGRVLDARLGRHR